METYRIAAYDSHQISKDRADVVCDGVGDEVEINDKIAALGTLGGTVGLSEGTYKTAGTINMGKRTALVMSQGAMIRSQGDFNVISFVPASYVEGGKIHTSDIETFSKAALYFNCSDPFTIHRIDSFPFGARNMALRGRVGKGYGIHVLADQNNAYSVGMKFTGLDIFGFENGIRLEREGPRTFINSNFFDNFNIHHSSYGIYIKSPPGTAIGSNYFTNWAYQAGTESIRAVYAESGNNHFGPFRVWDWHVSSEAVSMETLADSNRLTSRMNSNSQLSGRWELALAAPDIFVVEGMTFDPISSSKVGQEILADPRITIQTGRYYTIWITASAVLKSDGTAIPGMRIMRRTDGGNWKGVSQYAFGPTSGEETVNIQAVDRNMGSDSLVEYGLSIGYINDSAPGTITAVGKRREINLIPFCY